ncbi:hypothetical protein CUMW_254860 [Citrus unshiu]|uniref:Leucine-rich repeat-containing N-terminal plant-type domain-containing protein n=1 Tax=Citrus unshiu TaxID=55188 RepID=A0A2H5QRI3_CITUN|nr:hypothetical protein CUMW_254860 [Citrus unshiu]
MKNSFIFDVDSTPPAKMSQWSESTNCCDWTGVDCDEAGHVIGLDLSAEPILIGRLENASGLFSLQYMQSQFGFHSLLRIPCAIQNLKELRELYLDNVDLSGLGTERCKALSFLPNLQLSSFRSYKSSPGKLTVTLSVLRLHDNHAASWQVPEFVANLLNLTNLDLSQCDLRGKYPEKILQVSTLETLDLSYNPLLQGSLPNFPKNSYLQNLNLANTSFSGILPDPIGILKYLTRVDLRSCSFTGPIPTSTTNLTQLFHVDFSSNHFSGPIPSFHESRNLNYLDLSSNNLNEILLLSNNQFENQLPELSNVSSFVLSDLDLSGSRLEGPVPISIFFEFRNLETLDLSSNKFSRLRLASSKLRVIPNLKNLDLSNNQISGENLTLFLVSACLTCTPTSSEEISLACHQILPTSITLNNNFISIPADIGNFMSRTYFFATANNSLTGFIPESVCKATYFQILDLSNNNLSGTIPVCLITNSSTTLGVLNLGRNNLNGTLSDIIFPRNCGLHILDLSGNQLQGVVPKSLANCNMLQVLDFRNNHISDNFPCWLRNASSLQVLVLQSNNFSGHISYPRNNVSWPLLQIVDFASNKFGGRLSQKCQTRPPEFQPSPPPASSDEIDWFFIAMSIGFAVNKWHNDLTNKVLAPLAMESP